MNNRPDKICPICQNLKRIVCPKCQGKGKILQRYYDLTGSDKMIEETCPLCNGSGEIDCPKCSKI